MLDEVLEPKRALCFGARHNVELAGSGFPLDEVLAAEKSLHHTLEALRACDPLRELLAVLPRAWQR